MSRLCLRVSLSHKGFFNTFYVLLIGHISGNSLIIKRRERLANGPDTNGTN